MSSQAYRNRREAGRLLGLRLRERYAGEDAVVLIAPFAVAPGVFVEEAPADTLPGLCETLGIGERRPQDVESAIDVADHRAAVRIWWR